MQSDQLFSWRATSRFQCTTVIHSRQNAVILANQTRQHYKFYRSVISGLSTVRLTPSQLQQFSDCRSFDSPATLTLYTTAKTALVCVCVRSANSIPGDSLCLQVEFSLRGSGSGYEFKPTVKVFQVLHPKRWIPFAVFLPETRKVHCNTTPTRASVWITSRIGCWTLMSNAYPFSPSRLILLQAQLSNPRAPILLIRKAFNFQIAARPPNHTTPCTLRPGTQRSLRP